MGRGRGFGRGRFDSFFRNGRSRTEGSKESSWQQKIQAQEQKQDATVSKVPPEQSRIDHDAAKAEQQSRTLPGSSLHYDNTLSPEAIQRMNALPDHLKTEATEAAKPLAKSVFEQYAPKASDLKRDHEHVNEAERPHEIEQDRGEEH